MDFNENRVGGTDPLTANLTAVFAYYAYIILGLNFDSYGLRGGDPYFQKAQNIVNNAPETNSLNGWKPFDGLRNRYWLVENLTNPKYNPIHDAMYDYYRQGLDQMFDHEADARVAVMNALNQHLTASITNSRISCSCNFSFREKEQRSGMYLNDGTPDEKSRALDILSRIDVSNLNQYKQDLQ